ncbi:redox-sensing transcriptional repressor Rex [bacterium B17]|nr:redox-sensing transcriptional repressor Rex [bacterium B17]
MGERESNIPPSVLERMTKYLAFVQELADEGIEWVSSADLAKALSVNRSTVRQDLLHIDFSGISRRGYETKGFAKVLRRTLGMDLEWNMVIVGAGNVGTALALHGDLSRRGFYVGAIVDKDPERIGCEVGSMRVLDVSDLASVIEDHDIKLGVIAVPAAEAQSAADALIKAGIKGMLNLAMTHIAVPDKVSIVDSRIVADLLQLSHAVKNKLNI